MAMTAILSALQEEQQGLIASGDQFISTTRSSNALQQALRDGAMEPLAVEMEGAAVAQVCHDYGLPFVAVRTISDRADDVAHVDFLILDPRPGHSDRSHSSSPQRSRSQAGARPAGSSMQNAGVQEE